MSCVILRQAGSSQANDDVVVQHLLDSFANYAAADLDVSGMQLRAFALNVSNAGQ